MSLPADNTLSKMEVDTVNISEVDQLEDVDDEFESDDEIAGDPNAFKIHEPLQPPEANLFTTQILHSMLIYRDILLGIV